MNGQSLDYTNNQRIVELDMAKGLGILCIIAGHLGVDSIDRVVYTFHVPLFFLISGYFISSNQSFKTFISNKAKKLLIPYYITGLIIVFGTVVFNLLLGSSNDFKKLLLDSLLRLLYASGTDRNATLLGIKKIGAIWFLQALFWASCLNRILLNLSTKVASIIVAIIWIISYTSSKFVWLPLDIQAAGTALLFVYIGSLSRQYNYQLNQTNYILFILGLFVLILEISYNIRLFVSANIYDLTIVSAFASIFISYSILNICVACKKISFFRNTLCFLGKNSLIVLCVHSIELHFPWNILQDYLNFSYTIQIICELSTKILLATLGILFINFIKEFKIRKVYKSLVNDE